MDTRKPFFTMMILVLGLTACISLVVLAILFQPGNPLLPTRNESAVSLTQTARKKALDDYMTVYSPGGVTGLPPTYATRLAPTATPR